MSYYKVVKKYNDKLVSFTHTELGKYVVEYKLNEWSVPKLENSKLFIFNSLNNAVEFVRGGIYHTGYELYEIECINPIYLNHDKDIADIWDTNIEKYWSNNFYYRKKSPIGTCFCDSLKLVKKVL